MRGTISFSCAYNEDKSHATNRSNELYVNYQNNSQLDALGYLSEVERGQKEASSEILASVAEALDVPISTIMREVGDRLAVLEGLQTFPDVVPDELVASMDAELSLR